MLVEKEVIGPGTYWYTDQKTGLPRKLVVTPDDTKRWHDQGNEMLSTGLTVPVPYEHDFNMNPMTPKEQLLNNAGEVKEYKLKGDRLFGMVDIQDPDAAKKIGSSIRWTSPWFNSFTDGNGRAWSNVISHLALTTRPRVTKQEAFGSIAAALSMATETKLDKNTLAGVPGTDGFCLSRAGRLFTGKKTKRLRPRYPIALSMWSGIKLAADDLPPSKKKKGKGDGKKPVMDDDDSDVDDFGGDMPDDESEYDDGTGGGDGEETDDGMIDLAPFNDPAGDIGMEELLCDLLQALGVPMPDESNENEFKRHLYEAVMSKIKELTSDGMGKEKFKPDQNQPPNQQPNASQPNPLLGQVKQEQQPMYMSLEDINKLPEPMKGVALSMYNENVKLRTELEAGQKTTNSLRDAKLKEEAAKRTARITLLGRLSPKVKADLDAMVALPSMALSMGDGGAVVDPMDQMLAVLEKGLGDLPRLLTTDTSALSLIPHPKDADALTDDRADEIADTLARQMGCTPAKKAS